MRVEDRNVFVGECKLWKGPSSFAEADQDPPSALDQLLSYSTWRDANLALIMFVGAKGIDKVITSAREVLQSHSSFLQWAEPTDEGQLRCRVRLADDRAADLTVVFVHLPR